MTYRAEKPRRFSHQVYFKLADRDPSTFRRFVDSCRRYLSGHVGMTRFELGIRAIDQIRSVVDKDYDILMDMEFDSIESYEIYRTHPDHEAWITEFATLSTDRRVFDSYLLDEDEGGKILQEATK